MIFTFWLENDCTIRLDFNQEKVSLICSTIDQPQSNCSFLNLSKPKLHRRWTTLCADLDKLLPHHSVSPGLSLERIVIHANGSKLLKVECKYATMDRVQLTKHKGYQRKLQISSSVSSVGEGLVKVGGG